MISETDVQRDVRDPALDPVQGEHCHRIEPAGKAHHKGRGQRRCWEY
jgi:hypothetical protein